MPSQRSVEKSDNLIVVERQQRERDAQRAIINAGLDMSTVSAMIDATTHLLDGGKLHHRTIETRLSSPQRSVTLVRLALKFAWERGILTYVNDTACWNKEHRTFAVTAHHYPELDTTVDRHIAISELIATYFDRYGPATIKDAMWWSGLSRTAVLTAMHESPDHWVRLHTPWSPSPAYMSQSRWEEFAESAPQTTGLNFLAHEDVALKAYYESRSRYLGSLPSNQAFNQIGEVLPTIVWDGHVVGTWSWQPDKTVTYSLARGRTTPQQRKTIADRATTTAEALRLGWSNTSHGLTEAQLTLL